MAAQLHRSSKRDLVLLKFERGYFPQMDCKGFFKVFKIIYFDDFVTLTTLITCQEEFLNTIKTLYYFESVLTNL